VKLSRGSRKNGNSGGVLASLGEDLIERVAELAFQQEVAPIPPYLESVLEFHSGI
jgi:hypothetical protein